MAELSKIMFHLEDAIGLYEESLAENANEVFIEVDNKSFGVP